MEGITVDAVARASAALLDVATGELAPKQVDTPS